MTKENKNEEVQDTWINEELSAGEQAQPEQPNWFASNKGIIAIVGVFSLIMFLVWAGSSNNNNATNNNPREARQEEFGLFDRFSNAYNNLSRAEREGVRLAAWVGAFVGAFSLYKNRAEIAEGWAKFKRERTPVARAEAKLKQTKKQITNVDKAISRQNQKKTYLEEVKDKQSSPETVGEKNPYKDLKDPSSKLEDTQAEIDRLVDQKEKLSDDLIEAQEKVDNAKELAKLYR